VVAADGVRSLFRGKLIGDGEPRPIGYVATRTIVPIAALTADVPRDCVLLWGGPGFHIVHYPLRHNTLFNIAAVFRTPTYAERGDAATHRAELETNYRDAHPAMRALTAMMDLSWRRPIGDRDPVRRWHKGRIVLIGDAAHAPLQSPAGSLHGDRGQPLPCRANPCSGWRLCRRVPALHRRAAHPHRTRPARVPGALGVLSR
jgi:salicylate hydroxylase